MQIIGLTGGIACGKSTISQTLRELGAVIIDGDALSRELTQPGGRALPAIRAHFGDMVFQADGTLDRRALGSIVFGSDAAREILDGIMQPMLLDMIREGVRRARCSGAAVCVLDMPLLYEKGIDALCDRVWCAWLPRQTQLERLMARDGFTREEAEKRIDSQLPTDEKAARADVVIDTSGSIQYTKSCIIDLYATEVSSSRDCPARRLPMENTPYQRNRRAGRISALPEEQTPQAAVQPQQPAPQQTQAAPAQTPYPPQPVYPQAAHTAQPRPVYPQAAQPLRQPLPRQAHSTASTSGLAPAHQPQQPMPRAAASAGWQNAPGWQQQSPQPIQRRSAPMPQMRTGVPREQLMADDPETRRAARQTQPRVAPVRKSAAEAKHSSPAKTPSWLITIMCLLLVGVMGLAAASALMHAYLKTAADERAKAWENIRYNYHVTEQADGTLRVTWQDLIERYAACYNLNPAFVTAVIRNESSFRTDAVSGVGARGLMQMMPDTAEWVAGKLHDDSYDFDRLFEAETSIRYGCWYLNYLSELFQGDTVLVCAAYHAGQGEVWSWLGDPAISPDGVRVPLENIPIKNTKTYAGRVTQAYGIYQTLLYPGTSAPSAAADLPSDGGASAEYIAAVR